MTFEARQESQYSGEPVECFRFTHGTEVWRLTSAAEPHTLSDGQYLPEAIAASSIRRSQEWDTGRVNVRLDYLHPISQLFLETKPTQPVTLAIVEFHRDDGEERTRFNGEIASPTVAGKIVSFTAVPVTYRLKKRIPTLVYAARCPLALYGSRCGVDRTSFVDRMGVLSVTGATIEAPPLGAQADGWWTNGYVQTLDGEVRFIIDHTGDEIELEYPLSLSPGQQIDVYPGCDRSEATCSSKFSNLPNHLGFARIPVRELFGESVE